MRELFTQIVNLSITASFLIVAVIILRMVLHKAPKYIRYILWGMVALRLVIPFSFESSLSLLPNAQDVNPQISSSTNYVATNPDNSSLAESVQQTDVLSVLSIVWIVGVLMMLLYMAVSYIRVHLMVRECVRVTDNIYMCDHIGSPFVIGFFRPKIYINSSMSEQDAAYIIAHEQTHIRHLDNIIKPLAFVLLCIYWFNPLSFVAYSLFVKDIELYCDESVIKKLNKSGKQEYSSVLLQCGMSSRRLSTCPLAFSEGNVKHRIKTVLRYKKPSFFVIIASIALCIVTLALFMTNPVSNQAQLAQGSPAPQQSATQPEAPAETTLPTEPQTDAPTQEPTQAPTQAQTEAENVGQYYDDSYDDNYSEGSDVPPFVPFKPREFNDPWQNSGGSSNNFDNSESDEGVIAWDLAGTTMRE